MILVAGHKGQVARSLTEAAAQRHMPLLAFGRPELDLLQPDTLQAAVEANAPTAIVNAAAYTAVDQAESEEETARRINADGAANLAAAASEAGVPFIHISTDYVFNGVKTGSYTETDPVSPTGAYGRSKLAGEKAVLAANPQAIILRTAWVYSPFGKNFLKTMLSLATRENLSVVADQFGNPTYAPDIAGAILDIIETLDGSLPSKHQSGIYHLAGTGDTSWYGFAEAIFDEGTRYGLPRPDVKAITTLEYPTPARRPSNSRLDCSKIKQTFGTELPNWRESTATCVKRLSETGDLG